MKNLQTISFSLFLLLITACSSSHQQTQKQAILIDESDTKETIEQVIDIDKVWSGHRVGFALLTTSDRQYIAYYNSDRHTVVGQRNLIDNQFELFTLPPKERTSKEGISTILGWDSHNYLTLAVDKEGYIHLSGNMHVNGLTYFRTTKAHDITTIVQVPQMVGTEENKCTYPRFIKTSDGELIFRYRDGGSGNGRDIYNQYACETQTWSRLIDTPLLDGQGLMNAYSSHPRIGPDNWHHLYWVWRDTPDCETNHDLSYMKSPDLKNWYNAWGEPANLPTTIENTSLVVDPIPPGGGIINLAAKLVFDVDQKPIFVYHKYGPAGNLQLYIARLIGKQWKTHQITDWDYRWEFSGRGSINKEFNLSNFHRREDGKYEVGYTHIKYGKETLLLDEDLQPCGKVIKPAIFPQDQPVEGSFTGLGHRIASDLGSSPNPSVRYVLKWESLASNRDKPRPKPWPEPSQLALYKLRK